ncbi:MAG: DUF448 domain-containing protein [Desulfovibrionaceae bacterium]
MFPIRTCVICRNTFQKNVLVRYVLCRKEGCEGMWESSSIAHGRGWYHCYKKECSERFHKSEWYKKRKRIKLHE